MAWNIIEEYMENILTIMLLALITLACLGVIVVIPFVVWFFRAWFYQKYLSLKGRLFRRGNPRQAEVHELDDLGPD